jgi:hypothetical protein
MATRNVEDDSTAEGKEHDRIGCRLVREIPTAARVRIDERFGDVEQLDAVIESKTARAPGPAIVEILDEFAVLEPLEGQHERSGVGALWRGVAWRGVAWRG